MIIKSHIRGGFRAAADYLKEYGKNEQIRLVEISDPDAKDLNEAFHNMWVTASTTRAKKALHHISINPFKDEKLTDEQVLKIVKRCEKKYGYKPEDHQRVIVEHTLNGRQHFHVVWCRVNLSSHMVIWPGQHWNKSKQAAREMERELGLKRPIPRRIKRMWARIAREGRQSRYFGRYESLNLLLPTTLKPPLLSGQTTPEISKATKRQERSNKVQSAKTGRLPACKPSMWRYQPRNNKDQPYRSIEAQSLELLAWAWENGRVDILAQFGIYVELEV